MEMHFILLLITSHGGGHQETELPGWPENPPGWPENHVAAETKVSCVK